MDVDIDAVPSKAWSLYTNFICDHGEFMRPIHGGAYSRCIDSEKEFDHGLRHVAALGAAAAACSVPVGVSLPGPCCARRPGHSATSRKALPECQSGSPVGGV